MCLQRYDNVHRIIQMKHLVLAKELVGRFVPYALNAAVLIFFVVILLGSCKISTKVTKVISCKDYRSHGPYRNAKHYS